VTPGAYTIGTTRFVVYTGTDNGVWQKQVGTAVGAGTTSLGGRLIGGPSPINASATGRIVFGEGTDNALWEKIGNGPWTSLGGRLTSQPGAAASSTTTYRVYVRGTDGAVWSRDHTTVGWGAWHSIGGVLFGSTGPSAAVDRLGTFWVLVAGTNRALWIAPDGGAFDSAGGVTNSTPALVNALSSGTLVGFARGTTNAGYFHRFGVVGGWTSMGGVLTSGMGGSATNDPSAARWSAYGLGTDNQVYEHAGIGDAFLGWTRVTP
jgi:hypothetical protein